MKEGITDSCWVCLDCGREYLKEQGKEPSDSVVTCHQNECCVCQKVTTVTHERNYGYLYHWRNKQENNMKQIRLTKLKEVDNPRHPNNIPVGEVHEGEYITGPEIGSRFYCGHNWSTSKVQEVIDSRTFRTLNSIYKWEYINEEL